MIAPNARFRVVLTVSQWNQAKSVVSPQLDRQPGEGLNSMDSFASLHARMLRLHGCGSSQTPCFVGPDQTTTTQNMKLKNKIKLLGLGSALAAVIGAFSAQASTTYTMYCTCYGWLDNSPPGGAIAYPQIHSTAGGSGTYSNPVTFATDKSELKPGTKVYVGYLKKYFIMEDDCAQCDSDWNNGKHRHIDLWCGGKSSSGSALLNCEDSLTRTSSVIVSPASNLSVSTTPLFNSSTKQCYKP